MAGELFALAASVASSDAKNFSGELLAWTQRVTSQEFGRGNITLGGVGYKPGRGQKTFHAFLARKLLTWMVWMARGGLG